MTQIRLKEEQMDSRLSEAFKSLRTNIQFCGMDKKVIMLTSCIASEGKSSISLHLAMSLAELGKRTVLIDADLRKSVLVGRIAGGKEGYFGLSHYLTGMATAEDVVCATNIPGLHLVYAGPFPPNPAELLSGTLFQELVKTLRETYDYVIVDTAPLGTVIDAAVVARVCDGAVLVVEAGKINYTFAQETKEQLEKSGVPVLGVVLNKVDLNKPGYGKYGKYGKYYGYGYGDYYGDDCGRNTGGSGAKSSGGRRQAPRGNANRNQESTPTARPRIEIIEK